MAITTDPDILFVFNETGSTEVIPNLNTANSDGDLTANEGAAGTPQYTWNQDTGDYEGYLDIQDDAGANMTYILTSETFASTKVDESLAMRFQIQSWNGGSNGGHLVAYESSFSPSGAIAVIVNPPTTGGGSPNDFDLVVHMKNTAGAGVDTTASSVFQDLTFGTDYALACSVDRSTIGACVCRFKLNAETEYNPSNSDQTGFALHTIGPNLGKPYNFDEYYGVEARLYYFAYWRNYLVSSADLALCNSDPDTTIPLWPGGLATSEPGAAE